MGLSLTHSSGAKCLSETSSTKHSLVGGIGALDDEMKGEFYEQRI
jgi:hypothetical protein